MDETQLSNIPLYFTHLYKMISFLINAVKGILSPDADEAPERHPPDPGFPSDGIIRCPPLPDSEARVNQVCIFAGDDVTAGQALSILENSVCTMEIPSPLSGKITEIFIAEGKTVKTSDALVKIIRTAE